MSELSAEARRLILTVGKADGPSLERRRKLRNRFLVELGAGVAGATIAGTSAKTALAAGTAKTTLAAGGAKTASAAAAGAAGGAGAVTAGAASAPLIAPVAAASAGSSATVATVVSSLIVGGAVGVGVVAPAAYLQSTDRIERPAASISVANAARAPGPKRASAERLAPPLESTPSTSEPDSNESGSNESDSNESGSNESDSNESGSSNEPEVGRALPKRKAFALAPQAAPSTPASRLAEETRLIKAARGALSAGRGGETLAVIASYAQRFPSGALRQESMALRVLALCLTGSVEAARSAAQAFVATAPASPLLPRLEQSCVADVPGIAARAPQEPPEDPSAPREGGASSPDPGF